MLHHEEGFSVFVLCVCVLFCGFLALLDLFYLSKHL